MTSISTYGTMFNQLIALTTQKSTLATLDQELASGKQYPDLTQYDPTTAGQILNFQNEVTQRQSYLSNMQNVNLRLTVYDQTLSDMENIAQQAESLSTSNQSYDPTKLATLKATAYNYLKQLTDDLNQRVGDRYIYSGVRYSTAPVVDLTTLTNTPSTTTVSNPNLPPYDTELVNSGTSTDANSYTSDSVLVDVGYSVQYGISANDPSFQKLIAGIQFINQAANSSTASAYQTAITNAASLLTSAFSGIQTLHSNNAYNQNIMTTETQTQNTDITNIQNQLGSLQQVDLTQVGTEINLMQTQLQASYSATASLEQLSILKYL